MDKSTVAFGLLVAAAWSDGTLHPAEALILQQYLMRLELSQEDKQRLLEYLRLRPAVDTSSVWLAQLQELRQQPAAREELLQALRLVIAADGQVADKEAQLYSELKYALAEVAEADEPQSLLGRMKQWLKKLTGQS